MDDETFKELYKRYVISLRFYVITQCRVSESEADDVVQEIFLRFWKSFHKYSAQYSETVLLFLVTKNIVSDYWQKKRRSLDNNEKAENKTLVLEICYEKSQQAFDNLEIQICLEQVFAQLEKKNSDAYLLNCLKIKIRLVAGHSIEDIATQINRTLGATRQYISTCRKKLMQHPLLQECWKKK